MRPQSQRTPETTTHATTKTQIQAHSRAVLKWWRGLHLASSFIAFYVAPGCPAAPTPTATPHQEVTPTPTPPWTPQEEQKHPEGRHTGRCGRPRALYLAAFHAHRQYDMEALQFLVIKSKSMLRLLQALEKLLAGFRGHQRILIASNGQNCCFHLLLLAPFFSSLAFIEMRYDCFVIDVSTAPKAHMKR